MRQEALHYSARCDIGDGAALADLLALYERPDMENGDPNILFEVMVKNLGKELRSGKKFTAEELRKMKNVQEDINE